MSLKIPQFPKDVPVPESITVKKAAEAWGMKPESFLEISKGDVLTSKDIRRFILQNTILLRDEKHNTVLKECFVRFMVLSLKHPLMEDLERGILQLLGRDYLKPKDMNLFRTRFLILLHSMSRNAHLERALEYYEKSKDEYLAQFPKRVLIDTAQELLSINNYKIESKISRQMAENLATCIDKMEAMISRIPIVDKLSSQIIGDAPLVRSLSPLFGSLRLRRPVADSHTNMAIGG